jgi:hypothetical protein
MSRLNLSGDTSRLTGASHVLTDSSQPDVFVEGFHRVDPYFASAQTVSTEDRNGVFKFSLSEETTNRVFKKHDTVDSVEIYTTLFCADSFE